MLGLRVSITDSLDVAQVKIAAVEGGPETIEQIFKRKWSCSVGSDSSTSTPSPSDSQSSKRMRIQSTGSSPMKDEPLSRSISPSPLPIPRISVEFDNVFVSFLELTGALFSTNVDVTAAEERRAFFSEPLLGKNREDSNHVLTIEIPPSRLPSSSDDTHSSKDRFDRFTSFANKNDGEGSLVRRKPSLSPSLVPLTRDGRASPPTKKSPTSVPVSSQQERIASPQSMEVDPALIANISATSKALETYQSHCSLQFVWVPRLGRCIAPDSSLSLTEETETVEFEPGQWVHVYEGSVQVFPWTSNGNAWIKGQVKNKTGGCLCGFSFKKGGLESTQFKRPSVIREHLSHCHRIPRGDPLARACRLTREADKLARDRNRQLLTANY